MIFSLTKSIYLKEIVTCVTFLRFMYAIVCSTIKMMIKKIKIKAMFDSDAKINYMLKKFANAVQLFIRQDINIIIINAIEKRARFFDVCEAIFINIESITISVSIFVVKRFNFELSLKRFF